VWQALTVRTKVKTRVTQVAAVAAAGLLLPPALPTLQTTQTALQVVVLPTKIRLNDHETNEARKEKTRFRLLVSCDYFEKLNRSRCKKLPRYSCLYIP